MTIQSGGVAGAAIDMDMAPCGFLRMDDHGRILRVNQFLAEMLGYVPGELEGKQLDIILSAGARVFCQTHFFPMLRLKGGVEEIYFGLKAKSGESVPMLVNAVRKETADGLFSDLVVVRMTLRSKYEDELLRARQEAEEATRVKELALEAQRKVEAELRTFSERLKIATDVSGIAVGEIDLITDTIQLSAEAAEIFGLGLEAVTVPRKEVHDTFHAEEVEQFLEQLRQSQDPDGNGIFALEHRILHKDGSVRWVSARKQIHFDRDQDPHQPVRGVLVIQEITARKQMEAELSVAHQRKDEFIATLAHELRNPLSTIQSGLQLLQFEDIEPEQIRKTHAMMTRQAGMVVRLVDDLMDLNRIARGKVELRMAPVDLTQVLATAVEATAALMNSHRHHLEVEVPTGHWIVIGDRHRLVQVVSNLLTNAAKYTEPGGEIVLHLERQGDMVLIRVKDNGIGIERSELPLVFNMFAQVGHQGNAAPAGGLGIGLNIVQRLVEMHKGTVEASSEGQGRGSEFMVRLPLVEGATHHDIMRPDLQSAIGPLRILVVDDNEDAAVSLALFLKKLGHEVEVAHGGQEALLQLAQLRPQLVFMDIAMPVMSGYETCRRMRATPEGRATTLVALSGSGGTETSRKALGSGFDRHSVKPMDEDTLLDILKVFARSEV